MTNEHSTKASKGKEKRKDLIAEYGMVFVCISFAIFLLEMVVLIFLITLMGWEPQVIARTLGLEWLAEQFGMNLEIPETSGTIVMAYILTRPLKFVQIPLAALLTPPVSRAWQRRQAGTTSPEDSVVDEPSATPASASPEASEAEAQAPS